ncbi:MULTISPECIES: DUF1289 domain-containing protein [Thiohalobacter]|nr:MULTISPECIES: DUF1289 domain-containing protein [Thiohalobacter]
MATIIQHEPASPCIRVCTLDDDDVCLGCGRTLGEITEWGGADPARRREILAAAEQRRAAGSPSPLPLAPQGRGD